MPKMNIPFETLLADLHGPDWKKRCDAARWLGQSRDPRAVAALLPDLQDKDWRVRRNAAQALGALKLPDALEPLLLALNDKTLTVRQRAAVGLGRLKDERALPALLQALQRGGSCKMQETAYRAIRKFGHKAGPAVLAASQGPLNLYLIYLLVEIKPAGYAALLLPHLTNPKLVVSAPIIQALGHSQDAAVIKPLLEHLADSAPATQALLAQALGELGAREAVPQLLDLLIGDDLYGPRFRLQHAVTGALQQLSGIQAQIEAAFPRKFPNFAMGGAITSLPENMGLLGETGFQQLNTMLAQMETNLDTLGQTFNLPPTAREKLADQTWKFGALFADARDAQTERIKLLLTLLQAETTLTRVAAALSLAWYMDAQALGPLAEAAQDPDPAVQRAATWAQAALQTALVNWRRLGLP